MCQILAFDRAARVHADYTYDQVLRACRLAAVTAGCNNAQRAAVESAAKKLISTGLLCSHEVIKRCRSIAEQLAKPAEQVPA